jgi:methylglutaconyl-CoA hydratase
MQQGTITSTIENGIGTISFYHPQSNSLPGENLRELARQIEAMGANDQAKVIVLKSEGDKTFCAGASFDELISIDDATTGTTFFSGFAGVINAMRKAPKFVIARVQGKAVGGGVGIACSADYCYALNTASVKLSELAVGIGPFVVGPAVERKIGKGPFCELTINATEWRNATWAKEKAMYADTFETIEEMDAAIRALATQLATSNPQAMAMLKTAMWQGCEHWDTLLIERAQMSGKLVVSDFTRNAISKFKTGVR